MVKHLTIVVWGRVQGVNYRASAARQAGMLGVRGFVRNEADGSVYIEAEAPPEELERFTEWCRRGPARARVDRCEILEGMTRNYSGFEIRS